MASNQTVSSFNVEEPRTTNTNRRFQTLRRLPISWIITAVIFYCASVITVGLLAGLLPKRTQQITVIGPVETTLTTSSAESTIDTSVITSMRTTTIITATATATTTTTTTTTQEQCIDDECKLRLSADIKVDNYELEYMYNNTNQTEIQGRVTIEFTLKQPIRQLIYHAKRMIELKSPALLEDNLYRSVEMRIYAPNDYISLRLTNSNLFAPNRYKLIQDFIVNVNDGNVGFYQNIYTDENQTTQKLLATKFEPTDARKAFPCFDEPQFKAKFRINIIHPIDTIALANFPVIEEELDNNLVHTKFAETFPMSTYLAAWAVLPNTYGRKSDDEFEPMFTTWARRGPTEKNHTAFSLEIASKSIDYFTEYFNTNEPVPPKIDLLAIPDFSTGAMENWGLVSFREDRLIFDSKIASTSDKQQLAETVAHELAHFWFGNYVTCKWWDDLWLNEAMANWLLYKPLQANYSDWNMELQSLTYEVIPVMWDDAKPSSHPIIVKNLTSAADITSLFDSITYAKGASILRMVEKIVGFERFRDSLRDYLLINAFDVGDPTVFYNKLFSNSSGEDFMNNWLEELNYPLLNVELMIENENTKVKFTQSRFIISNVLNSSNLNSAYRWKINIQCTLGGIYPNSDTVNLGNDTINFLFETEENIQIISNKKYSWIKCNRDFQGFFVTKYSLPSNNWQSFSTVLEAQPTFFSNEDKVNLLQDSFLLAYKGLIDYIEPIRLLRSLIKINIKEIVHWKTFYWHWEMLADLIDYLPNTLTKFQNFAIQQILANGITVDSITTINSDDDHNTKLVKSLQFEFLCRMNHKDSIEKATQLFRSIPLQYFNNSNIDINVNGDFLSTVYKYHIKSNGNDDDWNLLYNYYKIATSPQERNRALFAISLTNNTNRLNELLNEGLTSNSNNIRRQDYFSMIRFMTYTSIGRETVWNFYRTNYAKLVEIFTLENRRFGTSILSIARTFENESYINQMNQLFTIFPNAGAGTSARQQAIDQVQMNIEWIRSREQNLINALDSITRV